MFALACQCSQLTDSHQARLCLAGCVSRHLIPSQAVMMEADFALVTNFLCRNRSLECGWTLRTRST
jgi:hypothetical protein